jgi:hypothetical protein
MVFKLGLADLLALGMLETLVLGLGWHGMTGLL